MRRFDLDGNEPVKNSEAETPLSRHGYLRNFVAADRNHDAKRAALDLDLRRPVKPRWPEFDRDLGGKPAGMPV
ncbi:hypothetical protein [Pseudomonas synxantha]|nr:hypothetical protein [Pseudomonas synxantha]